MKQQIFLLLLCGLLAAGCGGSPTSMSIDILNPIKVTTCILAPSQVIALSMTNLEMPTNASIAWQVTEGQGRIDGPADQPTVTYVAPDTPREVIIRVQVSVDGRVIGAGTEACTVEFPKTETPAAAAPTGASPTLPAAPENTPLAPSETAALAGCACQKPTFDEIFTCLIRAESQAANTQDFALIDSIFYPSAVILRGDDPLQTWASPRAYYESAFAEGRVSGAMHEDIQQVAVQGETYFYVSGSKGSFTPATSPQTAATYTNPAPSEHWVFERSPQSCWVITRFEFNAAHIPFP